MVDRKVSPPPQLCFLPQEVTLILTRQPPPPPPAITSSFVLFTVRDDSKHHVACKGTFCLSPRGPAHVPIGSPVIEEPFWEVRGDGDKVEKDVDGRGQICDVIKKGERKSKTGKLIVTIPGGHQVKMYDYGQASKMEKILEPIWFNKKN